MSTNPTRKPFAAARAAAQPVQITHVSRRYRQSPIFRRAVIERVEYYACRSGDAEISALVVESMRRQWPGMTEADVDWIVAHCYLAERGENATRREAARNGEQLAREAGAAVWSDALEVCA